MDYATVYLTLSETYKLDENANAPLTFPQRIARSFTDGLRAAGEFFEELVLFLAGSWIFLLVLAAVIVGLVRVLRRKPLFRRKSKKLSAAEEPKSEEK